MLDADRTVIRKAGLGSLYSRELRKAINLWRRLAGCRQVGRPWACDASLYDCTRAVEASAILVGDAASFIEPLSSAGVKKALASAWRAAVVVHTCLSKPHMRGPAFVFHDRRERDVYSDCLRRSATFFGEAAAVHDDPFWSSRACGCSSPGDGADVETVEANVVGDGAIRQAYQRLRDQPTLGLKRAPQLRFERTAVIEGCEIVLRDAVVVPGFDDPVRFWAGVNVPELIRIAADCRDIATLIETYHRRVVPIDPRSLLVGLSLLTARGAMVSSDVV
jgi:hypothetical protein